MKVGIMQPYFLPYIGYFQLMRVVDKFVVYDNIEFTKKGWINRNRMLQNGSDEYFTIPLKKGSDFLFIKERFLSDDFEKESSKMLRKIESNYRKAPFFNQCFPLIEEIFFYEEKNLFEFIYRSLVKIKDFLDIKTPLIISSSLPREIEMLKSQDKVIAICKEIKSTAYINAIGGMELYSKEHFASKGIDLKFIKSKPIEYKQFNNNFVPWLSIIDVLMFNSIEEIQNMLNCYELI